MPAKRKEDKVIEDDAESLNTTASSIKSSKRTRNSNKSIDADPQPSTCTNERQTRHKSMSKQPAQIIETMQYFEDYFDAICSHQDESQRYLANVFYVLPSRKDYPDYYEAIKNPIDLKKIAKSILNSKYKSLRQIEADLSLMLENAKRYNEPKSVIYKDACKLKKLAKDLCKEFTNLMDQNKLLKSTKTREKKIKLLQEIAQMDGEDFIKQDNNESGEEEENDENEEEDESAEESEPETKSKKSLDEIEDSKQSPHARSKNKNKMLQQMWSLFDFLREFKQSNNKTLIDPFLKLPSKRLYPDYYQEIKQPIALNMIKARLNKRLYNTFSDFLSDLELVFNNAMQYNLEESVIYLNAKRLLEVLKQKSSEHLPLVHVKETPMEKAINQTSPSNLATPTRKSKQTLPRLSTETTPKIKIEKKKPANIPKFSDIKEKLIYLYNFINDFELDERELAPPFRHLPSKSEYPDYYNVIKKPIDMSKIWNRINHLQNSYPNLDDMCTDFSLMFENACSYNEPSSTLYKDALNLHRALFTKRDEMIDFEMSSDLSEMEHLPDDFVQIQIQELIENLFDSCMQHQDPEGRVLSETFIDLYNLFDLELKETSDEVEPIRTFHLIQKRIKNKVYKRLDDFQDEMFQVFNQIRLRIRFESENGQNKQKYKINRNSQLFRDSYDLQRYFIQKRDELCRNGELLLTAALSYKLSSLDSHITALIGAWSHNFDESEALMVEQRYKPLELKLNSSDPQIKTEPSNNFPISVGNFYFFDRNLIKSNLFNKEQFDLLPEEENRQELVICVLAINQSRSSMIAQVYLKPSDHEFFDLDLIKSRKFFQNEIFKSDLYALVDLSPITSLKACLVLGLKEHLSSDANFIKQENSINSAEIQKSDIYICESIYSSYFKYFRKLSTKKWSPLQFVSAHAITQPTVFNFTFTKRANPLQIERKYLDEMFVQDLVKRVDSKLDGIQSTRPIFKNSYRATIQYDALPASFLSKEKDADEMETTNVELEDPELMKKAKYYEQLVHKANDVLYKLGDYVYIKYQQFGTNSNESVTKDPLIVRIDRLWSIPNQDNTSSSYFLRGPVFLRPTDIPHEPTRLFYRNEVFKEISRDLTVSLDEIASNTKCVVMNPKKYCSSRFTEINEKDVFICETKFSSQNKTFRKFTKGLRKFELSVKCSEDEVYFMRKELQLRKHLSPLLTELNIDYEDDGSDYLKYFNDPNNLADDEEWNEQMKEDENSSQSVAAEQMDTTVTNTNPIVTSAKSSELILHNENSNSLSVTSASAKKVRVKRAKKSGFNLFSKDFRKSLRDTQSSLSFTDMSKEVGLRWRAMSDTERASYEEKAVVETAKEANRLAVEESSKKNQQLQPASPSPAPQPTQQQLNQKPQAPIIIYQQQGIQPQQQIQVPINYQNLQQNQEPQQINYRQMDGPKQVLHREAYIRYIANIKKQQLLYQSPSVNINPAANAALINQSDWFNSIDTRSSRIKESKVSAPPTAWIENSSSGDVLQNLLNLRYYLLNDAINIERGLTVSLQQKENECESELLNDNDQPESITMTVL